MRPILRTIAALASAAATFGAAVSSLAADPAPVPLTRAKNRKLFLHVSAPGGPAWMLVDTGAPISCADISKTALFHFKPVPKGGGPSRVISNGIHDRIQLIPELGIANAEAKDFYVETINVAHMNQEQQMRGDLPYDGILGLGDLCRMHAIIDCGAGTLQLGPHAPRDKPPAGWIAVPITVLDEHYVVPGVLNGAPTHFCVDTGSSQTTLDISACRSFRIPLKSMGGTIEALGLLQTTQMAAITSLKIGERDTGPGDFVVFDARRLIGPQQRAVGVAGFLGSQMLAEMRAIVDCDAMQIYLKQP